MNSNYYNGLTENGGNVRFHHYPRRNSEEEEVGENEPQQSFATILESVPLGTDEENVQLLNQIDQLRECRVDEYIDLPQIVVVGDQSSGKSSVLEALTNIPFPRSSVRCTRFATQIRLRRSNRAETIVKILPDKEDQEEKERLNDFSEKIQEEADFGTVFQRATAAIFPPGNKKSFLSKNILSVEVSGPNQPHLTVVDLPGIIHSATGNQTAADKEAITTLANSYMEKERTIILPVVSCSSDTSNQVILDMVKAVDNKGVRTLGIITKPDMTLTEDREREFIELASNKDKENKLQLGWHVLRNRAHDETNFTAEERKQKETEFFANSNWGAKLKASQLGVDNLSKRLSTQLIRHIAAEVWKVRADIERELKKCRERLDQLGDGKDEPEEMRAELFRWCDRSRELTQAALAGHGINPPGEDFFPSPNDGKTSARNFRSRVVIKNYAFATQMENLGSACLIIDDDRQSRKTSARSGNAGTQLDEITRSDYINKVVIPLLRDNPGLELSVDSNPLLVYRLFQSYSKNWPDHAAQHIEDIHKLCEAFLLEVLQYVWPRRLHNRVWDGFIQGEVDWRVKKAEMELHKLKADRLKLITPYESEFPIKYYQQKEADLAKQSSSELSMQKYEDDLRKMLLLYEVSSSDQVIAFHV
jgi:GTP-binding protein EngB required for normal cell division